MALPSSEAIAASLKKGTPTPQPQKASALPSSAHILSAIPGMAAPDFSQNPVTIQTMGKKSFTDFPAGNTKPDLSSKPVLYDTFGVPIESDVLDRINRAHATFSMRSTPDAFSNTPQRRLDAPTFGTNKYTDDKEHAALLLEGLDRVSGAIPYALSGGNPITGKPLVRGGGDYPRGISEQASNLAEEAFGTTGRTLEPGMGFKGKVSPKAVKGIGLVIGALGDPLNLVGGGEARGIAKLIRGAEDAEHVGTILREAGLAHDIADQYKTVLFDARTDAKAMHEALAAAEKLHNSTRMTSLIEQKAQQAAERLRAHAQQPPVPEAVKTLALKRAKQLGVEVPEHDSLDALVAEARKYGSAEEFVKNVTKKDWGELVTRPSPLRFSPVAESKIVNKSVKLPFGIDAFIARDGDLFRVIDRKTGQVVGTGSRLTRGDAAGIKKAIADAENALKTMGKKNVEEVMSKSFQAPDDGFYRYYNKIPDQKLIEIYEASSATRVPSIKKGITGEKGEATYKTAKEFMDARHPSSGALPRSNLEVRTKEIAAADPRQTELKKLTAARDAAYAKNSPLVTKLANAGDKSEVQKIVREFNDTYEKPLSELADQVHADAKVTATRELTDTFEAIKNAGRTPLEIEHADKIAEARARAKAMPETHTINTPERNELRASIAEQLYGTGAVNKARRADIVIGLPAAGKSEKIANVLRDTHGSLVIDSDMAKELAPEFEKGIGANALHKESDMIARQFILPHAIENGDNMVLPLVGKNTDKIREIIDELHAQGYDIHLHHNDLPVEKSVDRAISRFVETGRFVDPDYIRGIGLTPSDTYAKLHTYEKVKGYSQASNDVARGERPRLIEEKGSGLPIEKFQDHTGSGIQAEAGGRQALEDARGGISDTAKQAARAAQEEAASAATREAMEAKVSVTPADLPKEIAPTPAGALDKIAVGKDGKSWTDVIGSFIARTPGKARVHLFDYLRTPEYVLEKVGLGHIAEKLHAAQDTARATLKQEVVRIENWQKRVNNNPHASRLIFQYLDGHEKDVVRDMTYEEQAVAQEIRSYLRDWADRLHLPEDGRISHYITHIFERQVGERFESPFQDPELAALMQDKVASSVYDPFLQQRLGGKEYIEDVWRALDAYVKRGSRKEAMDPVLEEMANAAKTLDDLTYNYVKQMSHRINMRPTGLENLLDSFITQTPLGHKLTDRPTAYITKTIRQVFYRGTLGLNLSSAIRNLTQGVNTYAKLGEKYTVVGYTKLIERMANGDLAELMDQGILEDTFVQDRIVGVNKKKMQKIDAAIFAPFQLAEKINRGAAYFGAKAKLLSKGATEEEAIKYAKRIVRETQFAFGAVDTPVFLNDDVVKTLAQLQTYNIKQMEFLGRLVSQRDVAGMVRWTAGSIAMLYSLGYVIGMTKEQLLPTIGFGGAPITSLITGVQETLSSDSKTHAQGVSQLWRSGASLFPGGAQIRKTAQGAVALHDGGSMTPGGKTRFEVNASDAPQALLFGPSALPQAQEYYDSINAAPPNDDLQKRIKAQNIAGEEQKQEAETQYDHLKELRASHGANAAIAEWKRIAETNPELSKAIKQVGDAEAQGLTKDDRRIMQLHVANGARAQYLYDEFQKLDTKEEKQALWKEYSKKKIITKEVSTQLAKLFSRPD